MCVSLLGVDEKVSRATSKYNDSVDVQIKSNTSKEAREYDVLGSSCVVVDGVLKLSGDFDEAELRKSNSREDRIYRVKGP